MNKQRPENGTPSDDREFKQYLELLKSMQVFRLVRPERLKFFVHILMRLDKVSAGDGQWTACCPAHADSKPSLSITLSEKGDVLVNCFRGCSFADICRELNLSEYEMYDNSCASEPIRPMTSRKHVTSTVISADPKWQTIHEGFLRAITSELVDDLAHRLKVSAEALTALEVGWSADDQAWTFPEFNGRNEICGILRRYHDDQKFVIKGGKRGLTLPAGWREKHATLHICEGQSDVAAALSKGLNAIGRPGKTAGLRDLALICRDVNHSIVVVADNDQHDDGRPLHAFARQLSNELQKEIGIFRPPKHFKDLRDFLTSGVEL